MDKLRPDYMYIIGNRRHHKFKFRKNKLSKMFNESGSEREVALRNKIFRIYDSGKIKWIYKRHDSN